MTLVVGIAGATGSGKTTVARRLTESLPRGSVALLQHDSYYRDRGDLSYEQRCELNFDHPDSLETALMVEHLQQLRAGERRGSIPPPTRPRAGFFVPVPCPSGGLGFPVAAPRESAGAVASAACAPSCPATPEPS